jgi:Xaa-Pro aminopeptidase
MVVQPYYDQETGTVTVKTSFLCPSFEAERVRLLAMPFSEPINIITWEEHWNPYQTLLESGSFTDRKRPRLMVDEEMRDYIQRGLSENGFEVIGLQQNVEAVRQVKSEEEIDILRAVNRGTVEAVRQMRKCRSNFLPSHPQTMLTYLAGLYPGLTEKEVEIVLDNTLRVAGLEPFFDIVLFGTYSHYGLTLCVIDFQGFIWHSPNCHGLLDENASNPHGGTNGSKTLDAETFVLIDVGYISS